MTNFWDGKNVVVTGGAGFLGQHVVNALEKRNPAAITVPRKANYDLRDIQAVKDLLNDSRPDVIIHLAARVGGIGDNREYPAEYIYDNLMMSAQLLHEAYLHNVGKMVITGTVCSYPKITPVPFKEETMWDGFPEETNAPYGIAKRAVLMQSMAYRQQYDFNSIFLMPTNLYGPGDNFDLASSHVIPALIRKSLEAQDRGDSYLEVWGDGSPTREFLYVRDAAEGILLAAERYNSSEPVNLGSGYEISIKKLVETVVDMTGFEGEIRWNTDKPNGQPRRALDTSRAKQAFGFTATTPFETGLRETIQWYIANRVSEQTA